MYFHQKFLQLGFFSLNIVVTFKIRCSCKNHFQNSNASVKVFGSYCNFFIVLPIRLKTCRSNVFFFFTRQNVPARNIGRVICPGLTGFFLCRISYWLSDSFTPDDNVLLLLRNAFISVFGRSTLVRQCPMKSLPSVCPSVRNYVFSRLEISFFWYCTLW